MSTFTDHQISLMIQLIDARIALHAQSHQQSKQPGPFHTINDIRALILANLEELKSFCQFGDDFHVATLTAFLKQKTELTPDDKELMAQGKTGKPTTRFESQVQSCFSKWKNPPIERAVRRGYYRFVNSHHSQP